MPLRKPPVCPRVVSPEDIALTYLQSQNIDTSKWWINIISAFKKSEKPVGSLYGDELFGKVRFWHCGIYYSCDLPEEASGNISRTWWIKNAVKWAINRVVASRKMSTNRKKW
jgi:hypothetical protein